MSDLYRRGYERGLAAAQESENPVVLGSLFRSVAYALHSTGRFTAGVDLVRAAAGVLETHLSSRSDDSFLSVYGTLFLTGAVAAARADDRTSVASFLREAEDTAHLIGRDTNAMWTAFGPTNVAIHRMTTALELGDVQLAVDLAPSIDVTVMPAERQVRHAMEMARAYTARNRRDEALAVLLRAERVAPEQVHHHALSRQLVLSWVRASRAHRDVALDNLATRLRVI